MTQQHYQIVFRGELLPGRSRDEVATRLKERFRFSEAGLSRLFAGKPVVMKKEIDRETAERYIKRLKEAGLRCEMAPMAKAEPEPPEAAEPPSEPAKGAPEAPPEPVAAEPAWAPAGTVTCPACGYRQRPGERCLGCGADLGEPAPAKASAAEPAEEPGQGLGTAGIRLALAATRPWVLVVAVVLLLSAVGLLAAAVMFFSGVLPGAASVSAAAVGAGQALGGLLYLLAAVYLLRYARAIAGFLRREELADLEAALRWQKAFWKFAGMLTLLMIVLAAAGIAAALLMPTLLG